uniref:Uncharacterized protein n=1 Tax=Rhizophora mucronata TaxID=61149 RepID=A0A2P2NPM1_RHIMU
MSVTLHYCDLLPEFDINFQL